MATPTYTPIASITLGSSASSVTFSSIPQDYRDLVLVVDGTNTQAFSNMKTRINSDASSVYIGLQMYALTSGVFDSGTLSDVGEAKTGLVSNDPFFNIVQFMDYSATDKYKTILTKSSEPTDAVVVYAHSWPNTSAITNLEIINGTYNTGTVFALYGIEA